MKKIFLSISLIFVFSAYALYVRIIGTNNTPVALTPEPNKPNSTLNLPTYDTNESIYIPLPSSTSTQNTTPPTPTPTPTPKPTPIPTGKYRNGSYKGTVVDAYYGYVQVKAIISGGKITDVQFLDYPGGRSTSIRINQRAMPYLISEAISIQDSNVATVSGASFTSRAYRESLASALSQARI